MTGLKCGNDSKQNCIARFFSILDCLPFYYLFHGSEFHKLYLLHLPIEMSQNQNLKRNICGKGKRNVNLNYSLKVCFSLHKSS